MEKALPPIPVKRYFTIGEVGELCGVKPHVLRYWEQEFTQLRPMKRRGNRRYYQHHEVLMIRRIRDLLYDQGFTISGARNKLQELTQLERDRRKTHLSPTASESPSEHLSNGSLADQVETYELPPLEPTAVALPLDRLSVNQLADLARLRRELLEIHHLLSRSL